MIMDKRESLDIRGVITDVVRHLMVDHREKNADLGRLFKIDGHYFSRKLADGRWTVDDLDTLADHYGVDPADILQGYVHVRTCTAERSTTRVRDRITYAVRHLMLDHNEHPEKLGALFNMDRRGLRSKLNLDRWTIDNLDVLAAHYGVRPHDIVAGYDHLVSIGTEIHETD